MRTHYHVLGVSSSSSSEEIKAAYKRLAIQYHPDKNLEDKSAEEKFKEVNNSYQVLSDPQKKSNYDFIIAFQLSTNADANSTYSYAGSSYSSPYTESSYSEQEAASTYKRTAYSRRRYSKEKEERIAMIWVAVFLGAVFFMVIGAGAISSFKEEQHQQAISEKKLEIFGEAISFYQEKDYAATLNELQAIIFRHPPSKNEASIFMGEVLEKVKEVSDEAFELEAYENALNLLLILKKYESVYNSKYYFRIAYCYKNIGKYQEAIEVLEDIIARNERNIKAYTLIGKMYCEQMNECEEGLSFFNRARDIVVSDYTQTYGNAFSMLVSPSSTPESHFELYEARANAYFRLGNYGAAVEDINWATFLRPKKSSPYILQGDCYQKLNNKRKACEAWANAARLGDSSANDKLNVFCP